MNVRDWEDIEFFSIYEFDSPDYRGSGKFMKESFVKKLDKARKIAGIPFKINSGYRTKAHNRKVGGVSNSTHLSGWAADIRVSSNKARRIILKALIEVGLDRRIGIGRNFIHVDDDPSKPDSYWTYYSGSNSLARSINRLFKKKDVEY